MMKDETMALVPDLRAFARFLCREREAADELVLSTIRLAFDRLDRFEPGSSLKVWLFALMRNRFYADMRSQQRGAELLHDCDEIPCALWGGNPMATAGGREMSAALWQLSPQARECLVLVGAAGFSYEEAAELCGCTVRTLKARVARARRQLAARLDLPRWRQPAHDKMSLRGPS